MGKGGVMRRYHVVYTYKNSTGFTQGTCRISFSKGINIKGAQEYIKSLDEFCGDKNAPVIILNFIEFKKYEELE